MKQPIPKAMREQVWLSHIGQKYKSKCLTPWCKNTMTVFDFQCGHNIPESKGGETNMSNLFPICSRCNLSMSDTYTFTEWCKKSKPVPKWKEQILSILPLKWKLYATKESGIKSTQNLLNQNVKHVKLRGLLSENQILPPKRRIVNGMRKNVKK